jgi:hypothetical protein
MHDPSRAIPVDARRYLLIDVGVRRLRIVSAGLPVVAIKGILVTQVVYSRPCHAQQRLVIWAQWTAKNSDAKNLFFVFTVIPPRHSITHFHTNTWVVCAAVFEVRHSTEARTCVCVHSRIGPSRPRFVGTMLPALNHTKESRRLMAQWVVTEHFSSSNASYKAIFNALV